MTVEQFLDLALVRFDGPEEPERYTRARAVWAGHPALVEDLAVAVVAGDLARVQQALEADPGAADRPTGSRGWPPLLYLAAGRLDAENAVRIADLLLAAGADVRVQDGPFTVLAAALGGGELSAHPAGQALARTLLTAGADPADEQALYQLMFSDSDEPLRLLLEFGLAAAAPDLLRQQLIRACTEDRLDRVELLVDAGVDLESPLAIGYTPLEIATLTAADRVRAVLLGAGAAVDDPALELVAALLAADEERVTGFGEELLTEARIRFPSLVLRAAVAGRREAVELLVDRGFDVNAFGRADLPVEEPWETALHHAAGRGDRDLVGLLLELGADTGLHDRRFDATAAEWARDLGHPETAELIESGPDWADGIEIDDALLAELGITGPEDGDPSRN